MSPTSNITPISPLERSIGLVLLDEARRIGMSHKDIQEATGINDRSFRRYFVKAERHIPLDELERVAAVLHLPMPELMTRATDNLVLLTREENASTAAQHRTSVDKGEED